MPLTSMPATPAVAGGFDNLPPPSNAAAAASPAENRLGGISALSATSSATRDLGLIKFFGNILKAQGFAPGKNDMCNPSTVYQCLVVGQMLSPDTIGEALKDCLSPDRSHNKNCLIAYNDMIAGMHHQGLCFQQEIIAILRKSDPDVSVMEGDICALPHAKAYRCDFSSPEDAMVARLRLNRYVRERTNGFIKEIPGAGEWPPETRFVVVAALHMIAKWEQPFDPRLTDKSCFYMEGSNPKTVDMMRQHDARGRLNNDADNGYDFLFARPFISAEGRPLTMLYALPQKGVTPQEYVANREKLQACITENGIDGLGLRRAIADEFSVPKFDLQQTRDIVMPGAEDFLSDPSGTVDIKQAVRFEHGEAGVRAAAVTAMCVADCISSRPQLRLILDRPFDAFVIAPDESILFALHINDPEQVS